MITKTNDSRRSEVEINNDDVSFTDRLIHSYEYLRLFLILLELHKKITAWLIISMRWWFSSILSTLNISFNVMGVGKFPLSAFLRREYR